VAPARHEARRAVLEIGQRTEPVVLELKEPVGMVERLGAPGEGHRRNARQGHLGGIYLFARHTAPSRSETPAPRAWLLWDNFKWRDESRKVERRCYSYEACGSGRRWEAAAMWRRKSPTVHGAVNRVNVSNVGTGLFEGGIGDRRRDA